MKMNVICLAVTGALAVSACSSIPKPVIPDGSERTPVNTTAVIQDYQARTAEETANASERTALSRQVDGLNRQVAELKAYMMMMQMDADQNRPKASTNRQGVAPATVVEGNVQTIGAKGETVEIREQSLIFRVSQGFAKTDFKPSNELQAQMLKAAREAKHIEIRGRTDADHDNVIDRDIAMLRALRARRFLLNNGISPYKIKWSYIAAGGYVANNRTPQGKAKNRRVEIETMDIDTAAFYAQPQTQVGSAK